MSYIYSSVVTPQKVSDKLDNVEALSLKLDSRDARFVFSCMIVGNEIDGQALSSIHDRMMSAMAVVKTEQAAAKAAYEATLALQGRLQAYTMTEDQCIEVANELEVARKRAENYDSFVDEHAVPFAAKLYKKACYRDTSDR